MHVGKDWVERCRRSWLATHLVHTRVLHYSGKANHLSAAEHRYRIGKVNQPSIQLDPDCTSYEVDGLLAESPITFSVIASNQVGCGPVVSEEFFTTPPLVPDLTSVRLSLKEEATTWDTLTVGWDPAEPRGADVANYQVTLTAPDKSLVESIRVDGQQTEATFSPVRPCTPYQVTLVATNRAGTSEPAVSLPVSSSYLR